MGFNGIFNISNYLRACVVFCFFVAIFYPKKPSFW